MNAITIEELLSNSLIQVLKTGERPAEIQFGNPQFQLIPRHGRLQDLIGDLHKNLDPSIMVETLYLYQKPDSADKNGWSEAEITALYNQVIAISTLQGIQYYSASRENMRIFYESSSVIDEPSARRNLPDPFYQTPPLELSLYARQRDSSFGDNTYQYTFRLFQGALVITQENLTSLNVGIIPAVSRNRLRSVLAILDAGEYMVIYAVSMARAASLPGLRDRIGSSFSNRSEAIIQWLVTGADRAFNNWRNFE